MEPKKFEMEVQDILGQFLSYDCGFKIHYHPNSIGNANLLWLKFYKSTNLSCSLEIGTYMGVLII